MKNLFKIIICTISLLFFTFIYNTCFSQLNSNVSNRGDLEEYSHFDNAYDFIDEFDTYILYQNISAFTKRGESTERRSNFKMKLDSAFTWKYSINSFDIILSDKSEVIFDEENLKEITLNFDINEDNHSWEAKSYSVYHYNKNDLIIRQTYNLWNGEYNFDESSPNIIRNIEYNEQNLPSKYEGQNLSAILDNRLSNRSFFKYDSLANLKKTTNYLWNSPLDSLLILSEVYFRHDEKQQLTEIVTKDFSIEDGWQDKDSTVFSYDNKNRVIKKDRYSRTTGGGLKFRSSICYLFSDNDQLLSEVEYSRIDEDTNEWNDIFITEYEYDSFGNMILAAVYDSTNQQNNSRDLLAEERFKHLTDYQSSDVLLLQDNFLGFTSFIPENSIYNPILEYEYFIEGGYYTDYIDRTTKYFYSDFSTSTTNVEKHLSLKISPNPVVDNLRFDLSDYSGILDVTLWNTQGKLMTREQVIAGEELSVSQLGAGVYLYTAKAGDKVFSGRFIKL